MKNILIPTELEPDTVLALRHALMQFGKQPLRFWLFVLQETPQNPSAAGWLRLARKGYSAAQLQIVEECHKLAGENGCELKLHMQYSISGPLLRNFTQFALTDLVILTDSFRTSEKKSARYCSKLLANLPIPILNLGKIAMGAFSNALYLEKNRSRLQSEEIQRLLGKQFSFRIVSHAQLDESMDDILATQLAEAIQRNQIDLLVETRRPERIRLASKEKGSFPDSLGLPVLSVYEGIS